MDVSILTPQQAHDFMQKGAYYVDVRTEGEYQTGRPKGAYNVPFVIRDAHTMQMSMNPNFVHVMESNFSKDAPLILGCQMGGRSALAAQMLQGLGYTNVADVSAGWGGSRDPMGQPLEKGWQDCDLPTDKGFCLERGYETLRND